MKAASSVEEYLSGLPAEQRATMESIREAIRSAAPDATETISYQMPGFRIAGRLFVSYGAFRDHCSLFPASEGVRAVLGDELADRLTGKGTIRFEWSHPPPADLVRRIVDIRIREVTGRRSG
jgi:uncharacterized protein YdhG (YjbR/CyaY superfamily)